MSNPINIIATGAVFPGPGRLGTVTLVAGGAAATLVLRDGGSSGTIIKQLSANTNDSVTDQPSDGGFGQQVNGQLYATITGAGASANIEQM